MNGIHTFHCLYICESCEADQQWKVSNAVACFNGRGQRNKSTSSVSHYEKWMLSDSYHQSVPFIVWYKKHHPTITYFPLKTLLPRPKHCQSQDTLQGLPGKPISCKAALESGASLHLTSAAFNRYHIELMWWNKGSCVSFSPLKM